MAVDFPKMLAKSSQRHYFSTKFARKKVIQRIPRLMFVVLMIDSDMLIRESEVAVSAWENEFCVGFRC